MGEISKVVINMIKSEIEETGLANEKDPAKIEIIYDQIIQLVKKFYDNITEREIKNLIEQNAKKGEKDSKRNNTKKVISLQKDPVWIAQSRSNIDKVILEEIILKGRTIEDFKDKFKNKGDISSLLYDIRSRLAEYAKVLDNLNLGKFESKKEELQAIIDFAIGNKKQRLDIKKLYVRGVLGNLRICNNGKFDKIVYNHFDGQNYVAAYVMTSEGARFMGNESLDKRKYDKAMDSVKNAFNLLKKVLTQDKHR